MAFSARRKRTRKQSSSSDARLDCDLVPGEVSNSGRTGIFACPTFRQCLVQNKQVFRTDEKKVFLRFLWLPAFAHTRTPRCVPLKGRKKWKINVTSEGAKIPRTKTRYSAYFSREFCPRKNGAVCRMVILDHREINDRPVTEKGKVTQKLGEKILSSELYLCGCPLRLDLIT